MACNSKCPPTSSETEPKLDAATDRTRLEALRDFSKRSNLEFHSISAVAGEGVKDLVRSIADALDKIPRPARDSTLDSAPDSAESGLGKHGAVAANKEEDS